MNNHFGVSILPLVEFLICSLGVIKPDLMRDNKARFGLTRNDHVSQVSVVCLDIALTGAERQAL